MTNLALPILAAYDLPYLMLLLARTSGFFIMVPFFSTPAAPLLTRSGLALAVALLLYPAQDPPAELASTTVLLGWSVKELLTGLFLGGLVRLLFAGLQLAGQLAGNGIGLSLARMMDPGSETEDSLGPALYQYLGLMLFIGIGGHREVLSAVIESYRWLPVGQASLGPAVLRDVLTLVGQLFEVGMRLAAPIAAVLFIVDVLLALGNRVVPQIPILLVGMPVKAWLGVAALGWGLDAFAAPAVAWLSRAPEIIVSAARHLAVP